MSNRREFIKNIALGASALSLGSINQIQGQSESDLHGLAATGGVFEISGSVSSLGKPLQGVSVSDGYQVVQTNEQGKFNFTCGAKSNFVFISLPSGYQIPLLDNGSAQIFMPIDKSKAKSKYDFKLTPCLNGDSKHSFLVLADPQIQKPDEAQMFLDQTIVDIIKLKPTLNQEVFAFGCGDLVWDRHELFAQYNQGVQQTGIGFFQVFGNHDADLQQRSDEKSTSTFQQMYGPTYYSFNKGSAHYVVMDDVFFIGKGKEYIGYLSEDQLQWLSQDLKYVPKGSLVILAMHIPSYTGHFLREPNSTSLGAMVSNREHLYEILEPFNAHILSGHTHFNENIQIKENLYEHCHGTVCGAWWSGPICVDGTPSGYGVYEVDGPNLSWYYKATGESADFQFRVYKPQQAKELFGNWAVNIWNWDSKWKACYYEDGVKMGELSQIRAMDPLSVELHGGPKLPVRRKWVEPTLTDHLFIFKPSDKAKEIIVEVTDRFNKVYTQRFNKG